MATVLSILLSVLLVATPSAWADEAGNHKQELAKLKSQTQQKEQELKKYRDQEKKISKEMNDLQNKKDQTQRLRDKVAMDISLVEQNLISIEEKRAALGRSMPMWEGTVWEETVQYYMQPQCPLCPPAETLETELFVNRMMLQHATFATTLKAENREAKERFADFSERNKKLQAQNSKIKQEQAVISQSFQKKQKDLDATKQKVEAVRKEISELNKSAAELNNLLASFERKRKEDAAKKQTGTAAKTAGPKINVPPHSLPWPVQGTVVSKFGKEYRSDLNTWIFRDGIKIAAPYGTSVKAVAGGSVIYAGAFRSYGNVVIVDHGKGFFTIYGFLKDIGVSVGTNVSAGSSVGTVGKDTQASSGTGQYAVYFEMRQGTTAVDPLPWLK